MKNRKMFLTLAIICAALAFSVLGLTACEANDTPGLAYTLTDEGTYSVYADSATELTEIVIPTTYNGKPVTKIADNGFTICVNLKTVSIPGSVTSIGNYALAYEYHYPE